MQYKKNGQVNCNAVDLAVLHREAQKGKAWATPEAFLNALSDSWQRGGSREGLRQAYAAANETVFDAAQSN